MGISMAHRKVPTHIRQRAIELVTSMRRSARNSKGRSLDKAAQQSMHDADLSFSTTIQREERKPTGRPLSATVRQGAYALAQVTWGFPQTALGFAVFLAHARQPHFRFHGAVVTRWQSYKAMSAGLFVFIHGSSGTSGSNGMGKSSSPDEVRSSGGRNGSDGLAGMGGSGDPGETGGSNESSSSCRMSGSNESIGSEEMHGFSGSNSLAVGLASVDRPLLVHEYGHTIQSLVLGPLYLVVIGWPSVVWMNAPALSRWRARTGRSYYSFFTERWANALGERVLGEPSIGLARID